MNKTMKRVGCALLSIVSAFSPSGPATAQISDYQKNVFSAAAKVQPKVTAWRRDIHAHPELSNQEFRTAKLIADHLKGLGIEVVTGVAKTGVIGLLKGKRPGPVVMLRADMDALPVPEPAGLPFASKATARWNGQTVPVMHACGHDAHVAMLMGAAEILSSMRENIAGTVVFLFQPAEEGAPAGEEGGASLVLKDTKFANLKPDAIFGLHVIPAPSGVLVWRSGPFMAGSDSWELEVKGRQAHGGLPWFGVDAASVAAEIVTTFNQVVARQVNLTRAPVVMGVSEIHLGARHNIIPEGFKMTGTLRTFYPEMRKDILSRIDQSLKSIGDKYGVTPQFNVVYSNPVTVNNKDLARAMEPTLRHAASGRVMAEADYVTGSEDFAYYSSVAPTMYYHLGVGVGAPNHSPFFKMDESALEVGVRAHVLSALDYLNSPAVRKSPDAEVVK